MGTKKMGRPTDEPKIKILQIRISQNDIAKLDYCVEQTGESRAEILREGLEIVYQRLQG